MKMPISSNRMPVLLSAIILISFCHGHVHAQHGSFLPVNEPASHSAATVYVTAESWQPDTTDRKDALESGVMGEKESEIVRFNLGYVFPWGVKGRFRVDETFSLGAEVIPFFFNWNFYFGRGYYRLHRQEHWNAYTFGTLGMVQYRPDAFTAYGIGAGVGVQYNIRGLEETLARSLLPLTVYAELDGRYVNHSLYRTYYDSIRLRTGFRYNFRSQ